MTINQKKFNQQGTKIFEENENNVEVAKVTIRYSWAKI